MRSGYAASDGRYRGNKANYPSCDIRTVITTIGQGSGNGNNKGNNNYRHAVALCLQYYTVYGHCCKPPLEREKQRVISIGISTRSASPPAVDQ